MEVENLNIEDAMQEIYHAFSHDRLDEDEFTVRMYAELHGIPYQTANNHLLKALMAGKLTRRYAIHGGRQCWAYRVVRDAEHTDRTDK